MEKRHLLVGKQDICRQKAETTSMPFTLYKYFGTSAGENREYIGSIRHRQ
jgi:hypothetical protein